MTHKNITRSTNGKKNTASIIRLKPAYIEKIRQTPNTNPSKPTENIPSPKITIPGTITKTGRTVHWLRHLEEYITQYLLDYHHPRSLTIAKGGLIFERLFLTFGAKHVSFRPVRHETCKYFRVLSILPTTAKFGRTVHCPRHLKTT